MKGAGESESDWGWRVEEVKTGLIGMVEQQDGRLFSTSQRGPARLATEVSNGD